MGMVVRTNTMSANAYRQLGMNNTAVSKSLEKLSSGFRINRAGDDASGLAISEKMKAQISGLEQSSANAQDGISLVQTAEGALTEVHSMLNRMVELATKSANGTVKSDVDRKAIQTEVDALNEEITRIAKSTNFNGINLLDGTLGGSSTASGTVANLQMSDAEKIAGAFKMTPAVKEKAQFTGLTCNIAADKTGEIKLTYTDTTGAAKTTTIQYKNSVAGANQGKIQYSIDGGDWVTTATDTAAAGTIASADVVSTVADALKTTDLANTFDITGTGGNLLIEAKTAGATQASIVCAKVNTDISATTVTTVGPTTGDSAKGADAYNSIDITKLKAWTDGTEGAGASKKAEDCVFTVDGKKFAMVEKGKTTAARAALGDDVTLIEDSNGGSQAALVPIDATELTKAINIKLGYEGAKVNGTTTTQIDFKAVTTGAAASTGTGLVLQVGDTNDAYNKVTVKVDNLSAEGLKTKGLDVASQTSASSSVDVIKAAINTVSTNRGNLGALQNRLEHAINNLDTTAENMTSANSRIRDTDMAKEMMNYTKMNILTQAAQAMLAQANQNPQSILQLLQ